MLNIIRGRAGSGKTDALYDLISDNIDKGISEPLLIVPEQFSFITERNLLKKTGAAKMKKLKIFSFSRLCTSYFAQNKTKLQPFADDGVRCIYMLKALEALEGRLKIYKNTAYNSRFLNSLVGFNKEIKLCDISDESLADAARKTTNELLKDKLNDLILINETYDALLSKSYFDENELLKYFNKAALENDFFRNKTVYVDAFRAFSVLELECISIAMRQADDVYITFCSDGLGNADSAFDFIDDFENKLKGAAAKYGVKVKPPVTLKGNSFSGDIAFIESNIYTDSLEKSGNTDGSVVIAECADMQEECRFVACEIKKLIRKDGFRCRDIAVIERTGGAYKKLLCDTLERYDIPVFNDNRRPVASELLFIHLMSALECVTGGFKTENILRYLKTNLGALDFTEVSMLEKYALMWDIKGSAWLKDFNMHPAGFGSEFKQHDYEILKRLNDIRKKAVGPLCKLKENTVDKKGDEIAEAVYDFLIETKTPQRLFEFAELLEQEKLPIEAKRKQASWDALMTLIDTATKLCAGEYMSLKRWFDIFTVLADKKDLGEIPQGLDEVTVGSADRIRTDSVKVAFLVGVNKDEFPLVEVKNGILSDRDRRELTAAGVEVRPPFENSLNEERFIVYCALTAAEKKLYLTYKTSKDGTACTKSELIDDILTMLPDISPIVWKNASAADRIESESSAFNEFAKRYNENSVERNTLYAYFAADPDYADKLRALENTANQKEILFDDPDISKELFGKDMNLSASRIDSYYKCPFSYFCNYGLNAKALKKAEFNAAQSGTVVHHALRNILEKYGNDFIGVDDAELLDYIKAVLTEYLDDKMGGSTDKSKRFMYLFDRLCEIIMTVIHRLKNEFVSSEFKPCNFEFEIGEDIPAYNLPLDDGNVSITGSIDRVDVFEKDGIKYLRVIDYKTGKKDFKLCRLLDGLDIQMVLYLMVLESTGKSFYGETLPAGVLYLPSRIGYKSFINKREPSENEISALKIKSGKLSGMVLESPVVFNAMGVDKVIDYYPVKFDSKGNLSGNCYTQKQFKNLSHIVDDKIIGMGNQLHNGRVPVLPVITSATSACKFCDYKAICGFEDGDKIADIHSDKFEAVKTMLEEAQYD